MKKGRKKQNKNQNQKDECPLCKVSEDTLEILKKSKKGDKKEDEKPGRTANSN